MIRAATRGLIATALAALALFGAAPAPAATASTLDAGDCGPHYTSAGREVFDVDTKYVPPPLRAFPADCASRLVGEPFDDGVGASIGYYLVYADIDWSEFVAIVRSFEDAGYGDSTGIITSIDDDTQNTVNNAVQLTADDLAALDPTEVNFAQGQVDDPVTGANFYRLYYTDGAEYQVDQDMPAPSLEIEVILTGGFVAATGVGDPSVLSSLRTIPEALPNPVQLGVLGGSAVMLMLIVGYPGVLLNKVIGDRYDQVMTWMRARFRRKPKSPKSAASDSSEAADEPATPGTANARRPWSWLIWPGFVLAALIGGFVDPAFGVNLLSGRVLVSGFATFLLFNIAAWTFVRVLVARREKGSRPYIKFRWGSLLILAVAVLAARLLELQPGVIFGLVSGLAFGAALALSSDALVVLLGSGFALVIALAAWVGYTFVAPVAEADPGNVPLVFGTEFLSGLVIEGISTLPIALLPLGSLDGATIARWKKWVWGIAYAIGLAAFMLVLFTIPDSFGKIPGDFLRWVIGFGVFALVAIGIWALDTGLRRRRLRAHPSEPSTT